MASILITGASRGLGLEFAAQYLADGWTVHAGCRAPDRATGLQELAAAPTPNGGALTIHRMDVTVPEEIAAVAEALAGAPLDILMNNAAIVDGYGTGVVEGLDDPDIRNYDFGFWEEALKTNLLAPARITGAFVEHLLLAGNPIVAMVSSGLGSVGNNWQGGRYAYRTSKAGLNMLTRGLGAWLEPMGITVAALAPGWSRTEAGGPNAYNSVEDAVTGVRRVISGLGIEQTGTFWDWDGSPLPW